MSDGSPKYSTHFQHDISHAYPPFICLPPNFIKYLRTNPHGHHQNNSFSIFPAIVTAVSQVPLQATTVSVTATSDRCQWFTHTCSDLTAAATVQKLQKLLRLLSRNGRPDAKKIQDLFHNIDKDRSTSISTAELRVLLLGVRMDEGDFSTDRDVENILGSFDTTEDGYINEEEFTH